MRTRNSLADTCIATGMTPEEAWADLWEDVDARAVELHAAYAERNDAIRVLCRLLYDHAPIDCADSDPPCPPNCAWQAARALVGEKLDEYRVAFERGDYDA